MFSTLLKLAFLAAPALADFAISSPKLTQCQDAAISWEKTNGPYNLIIVNATNPCGDAVADLGDHDGTHITWKVALPAGYQVQLSLEDASGDEAWSGTITVDKSDDASCLPASLKAAVVASNSGSTTNSTTNSTSNSKADDNTNASPSVSTITPTYTVGVAAPSSSSSSTSPQAVGAANAGINPLGNGAPSLRQASAPVMVLGALAAVVVAAL